VRRFVILILSLSFLLSCKKDRLENELEILQGKWMYLGSEEERTNHVTGATTYTFIPSEFINNYYLEFERKGILTVWENEQEVETYRLQNSLYKEGCTGVNDCRQIGFNLNFDDKMQVNAFMNEDTMQIGGSGLNVPLTNYSDNVAEYLYLHIYVRIN